MRMLTEGLGNEWRQEEPFRGSDAESSALRPRAPNSDRSLAATRTNDVKPKPEDRGTAEHSQKVYHLLGLGITAPVA